MTKSELKYEIAKIITPHIYENYNLTCSCLRCKVSKETFAKVDQIIDLLINLKNS